MSSPSQEQQQELLRTIRRISLLLAFVIGFMSELAAFATNAMSIDLVRNEAITSKDPTIKLALIEGCLTVMSSVGTTILGLIGLLCFRILLQKYVVVVVATATTTTTTTTTLTEGDDDDTSSSDVVHKFFMDHADNRLLVGALSGAAVSWIFTDFVLMRTSLWKPGNVMLALLLLFFLWEGAKLPQSLPQKKQEEEKKNSPTRRKSLERLLLV